MKNPSILILLALALLAILGFVTYAFLHWKPGVYILFAATIIGSSVWIFKKEVDLWINKRSKTTLSDKEIGYLVDHFLMLDYIPIHQHNLFYKKVHLFCLDKEIISQDPQERVYHPAVLLCGAYAAYFEMNKTPISVPFSSVPVYVFYGHAFPSPQFQDLHISEYFEEDGALLFSVPHMIKGNSEPQKHMNILLYESGRVAMNGVLESVDFPSLERLCKFGGFSISKMEEYHGLKRNNISPKALALTLFFADKVRFRKSFPRLSELFEQEYIYR